MEHKNTLNPIVIHPHLLQKFMKQGKDFANLIALYSFYLYHANLQKTNQPLATDEFTRKGMSWALERVKRVKKILKELKIIEVVQKRQYSYIHIFFIYTQKKIATIFAKEEEKESVAVERKEEKETKSEFEETLVNHQIQPQRAKKIRADILEIKGIEKYKFNRNILAKWIIYCERNTIRYNKNNLKYWLEKINSRTSIEQNQAVEKAISQKWKDFYLEPIAKSPYHKFLGKSLMSDGKDCDTLLDIGTRDGKFVFYFKNIKLITAEPSSRLFDRCGYDRDEMKNAPIHSTIRDKIMGIVRKM